MEREHRHLDRERDQERREHRTLEHLAVGALTPAGGEFEDIERSFARLIEVRLVGGDDADQHQQRAEQRVEKELDRRVDPVLAAPHPDQQRHRDQHDLPEDVEDEEIERHEHAEHAGFEQQQRDVILARPAIDGVPRPDDGDHREQRGQPDQDDRDPVDAHEVGDAEVRQPVDLSPGMARFARQQTARADRNPNSRMIESTKLASADTSAAGAGNLARHIRDEQNQQRPDRRQVANRAE